MSISLVSSWFYSSVFVTLLSFGLHLKCSKTSNKKSYVYAFSHKSRKLFIAFTKKEQGKKKKKEAYFFLSPSSFSICTSSLGAFQLEGMLRGGVITSPNHMGYLFLHFLWV